MRKIRVLVVDDSAFMRKIISDMLESDPFIEVADTARDGEWAIEKLKTLKVDVVTMDIEMPRMNGLDTLKKIKEEYNIPVLMLSSLTREGADITMKALELGAFDFVLKPTLSTGLNLNGIKEELIHKIKLCCQGKNLEQPAAITRPAQGAKYKNSNIKAICIAASTGGPKALSKLMSMFPKGFHLPVFIVQHMPAGFTNAFAARLNNGCSLTVKEAADGDRIEPGCAYVAPGGYHMVVKPGGAYLALNKEAAMHGVRPSADKLFISAAENMGGKLIGIVLTGMGKDGTLGLEAIGERGGICIAEDESTCTIFGMPRSAIEKGAVHIVAPLGDIVGEVLNIIGK